jgi:hypothetical protein
MKVCDKCKKEKVSSTITIKGKSYELCFNCLKRIIDYLESPKDDSVFGVMGKMFKG